MISNDRNYPECTRVTIEENDATHGMVQREYSIHRDHGYIHCYNAHTGERSQVMRPSDQPGVMTAVTATSKTLVKRVMERCDESAKMISYR